MIVKDFNFTDFFPEDTTIGVTLWVNFGIHCQWTGKYYTPKSHYATNEAIRLKYPNDTWLIIYSSEEKLRQIVKLMAFL